MPIKFSAAIESLDQESFHRLDRAVMRLAFETHNELGCLLDEAIYQNDLKYRIKQSNLPCESESAIKFMHGDFTKVHYIDLLVSGAVYELKTASALTKSHEAQTLNYLLLTNTQHGKLINFHPPSVASRFISTQLTSTKRKSFELSGKSCPRLHRMVRDLFSDWGTHLEIRLYREALMHLLDCQPKQVSLHSRSGSIGTQPMNLLEDGSALLVSAIKSSSSINRYQTHLKRMLQLTQIKAFQWINLSNHTITLSTLEK